MKDFENHAVEKRLKKSELDILRPMKAAILADISELRKLESQEQAEEKQKSTVFRSLFRIQIAEDHDEQKAVLTTRITAKQCEFLEAQAALEAKISAIQNSYVRLVLSLHYVDLLQYREIAEEIGGISENAVQILIARYFAADEKGGVL